MDTFVGADSGFPEIVVGIRFVLYKYVNKVAYVCAQEYKLWLGVRCFYVGRWEVARDQDWVATYILFVLFRD